MKLPLPTIPEPTNSLYSAYNTGGVEVEVGEFLYGFIRMIKPDNVLELGTHRGISAASIGLGLRDNGRGKITTIEYEPQHHAEANVLFAQMKILPFVNSLMQDATTFKTDELYDFIFSDTEPHLRFNEFLRYWKNLKPGGFIGIHDLHEGMGQTGQVVNGMKDWPFGTIPEEMKKLLKEVQSFHFPTPRGFFLGQRKKEGFYEV